MKKIGLTLVLSFLMSSKGISQNTTTGTNAGTLGNGTNSTYYGAFSGENTTGQYNVFSGHSSGQNNSGNYNVLSGYSAGKNNTGDANIFIGQYSGQSNTGNSNVFLGNYSGILNTTGIVNTFIGTASGRNNTVGNENIFLGNNSGRYNTNGSQNSFIGQGSGLRNETGNYNVFVGHYSGRENTSGNQNTFIGNHAGYKNIENIDNTFIGNNSGANVKGDKNAFNGSYAGEGIDPVLYALAGTTQPITNNNTFMGYGAGQLNEGSGNVNIGYEAGKNVKGDNNVFIGNESGREEQGSNKLYIENTNSSSPLIWGDFETDVVNINGNVGIGTTTPDSKLDVRGVVSVGDESIENRFKIWAGGTGNANHMRIGTDYAHYGDAVLELYQNYGGGTEQNPGKLIVNGNIGIGTTSPSAKMHINTINSNGNYNTTFDGNSMNFENGGQSSYIRKFDTGRLFFSIGDTNNYVMSMSNNGNIGIGTGTDNPDEKLTVKGKIHTEEVRVDLMVPGPDYVFEKYFTGTSKLNSNYEMPTLEEVEAYTKANHHLPEIPSAQEMKDNGIQLKEMNLKLLQKIEELTLYTIQQQKELDDQKNKNKTLEARLEKIESLLKNLKE